MKQHENFIIGLTELRTNKLRTFLTMLGIIFGVGAVISMLSIGEGARQETLDQIELLGTNNIIVRGKSRPDDPGDKSTTKFSPGLNLKDGYSIAKINPLVDYITPQREGKFNVFYKSKIEKLKVIGTTPNYPGTFNSSLSEGKFFKQNHLDMYSNLCVIGSGVKKNFFRFEKALNKLIKIDDQWFRIIGVVASKAVSNTSTDEYSVSDFNNEIYIPLTTMAMKFKKFNADGSEQQKENRWFSDNAKVIDRTTVQQLTVKVKKDASIREAAMLTARIMERKHFGVKDYDIIVPEQLLAQKQNTQKIFNIVMGAIAGISLLVGGIGIMNIMLANILERTREIGIRRAIGATRKDVLNQFMYEAITISFLGGILGIITGFLLTSLITTYAGWRTIITPTSIMLAFIVSVSVGFIFGSYPAKKAADKDPIDSLRYE
jgi:putative ABC transport system permease protein